MGRTKGVSRGETEVYRNSIHSTLYVGQDAESIVKGDVIGSKPSRDQEKVALKMRSDSEITVHGDVLGYSSIHSGVTVVIEGNADGEGVEYTFTIHSDCVVVVEGNVYGNIHIKRD